ncbi:hypothetical protein BZL29_8560 [Mycobacterium kansasii]|uniref:Uncharacterized protein n=1 Tax=Mycobacterium kansasii TaxID=1768 RepID=A0A1V3W8I5_MYCKA|nr:hypothetical protein BZL29_8560 [Mycobacterium kansasii]
MHDLADDYPVSNKLLLIGRHVHRRVVRHAGSRMAPMSRER